MIHTMALQVTLSAEFRTPFLHKLEHAIGIWAHDQLVKLNQILVFIAPMGIMTGET
jgi:S-ribosylhomocysteine lyase LuxS involved in autoinducer biosynthesis